MSWRTTLSISLDQYYKVLYRLYILYAKLYVIEIYCRSLIIRSYQAFLKN